MEGSPRESIMDWANPFSISGPSISVSATGARGKSNFLNR